MRSFRIRLIVAFVALFAAISVAVSFVGLVLREQQIRGVFDRELTLRATAIADMADDLPTIDDRSLQATVESLGKQVIFQGYFVQVFDQAAQPIATSTNLRHRSIDLAGPFSDASIDEHVRNRKLTPAESGSITEVRSTRRRFKGADGRQYLAVVGTDPLPMNEAVNSVRWLFLGGNLGGLLAAAAAGWLVTGAMARRIDAIKTQVQTMGPEELSKRIQTGQHDEISELAKHLNAMLDRLKAGFETQERFIHDASHELKTPIATVQAEAQALMLGEPDREELLEFVRGTNDEMRRLGRLVEALLLLTRSNESRVASRFRTMDLTEITIAAIRHLSAMSTDHKVRLNLVQPEGPGEALPVKCDPELLEAMISNLIRNAVRFSPQKSEVVITLRGRDGFGELTVDDAGPGIPVDILPQLFDRYFQTSQTRSRRGAGLGLAIAITVVNLHGGSISASNRATHGASFVVRLPLLVGDSSRASNPHPSTSK